MDCHKLGFPVLHYHPEFAQTCVHWACDTIQPPHLLSLPSPPAFKLFQHQGPFKWVGSSHEVAKVWSFSFSISPFNEYSGLISFRIDWIDLPAVQGTLESLLRHHNLKTSVLLCSAFFMFQFSYPYMTTGKTIDLTIRTFISKVVSLLLKILSSFVTYFLPRSKHPWLWSPSTVILEPKKIKSVTVSIFPPIICHEVMGLNDMILVFECWVLSKFFSL